MVYKPGLYDLASIGGFNADTRISGDNTMQTLNTPQKHKSHCSRSKAITLHSHQNMANIHNILKKSNKSHRLRLIYIVDSLGI
jgi:hypothetical protein